VIAEEVLEEIRQQFSDLPAFDIEAPILNPIAELEAVPQNLEARVLRRLQGRYGAYTPHLLDAAAPGELSPINGQTNILWAELRWAARAEGVMHLDDLLLRRVRLGLVTERGGRDHMDRIRAICQSELGWDDRRWSEEEAAYKQRWEGCYSLPLRSKIPDWQSIVAGKQNYGKIIVRKEHTIRTTKDVLPVSIVVLLGSIVTLLAYRFLRRWVSS
jgi:glycerol-3-phosphate dehydrogenase